MKKHKGIKILLAVVLILAVSLGSYCIYITKVENQSIQSKFVEYYLWIRGSKSISSNPEKLAQDIENQRIENEKTYEIPADITFKSTLKKENAGNMEVFILNSSEETNKKEILYLHGGSYMRQPVKEYWPFLDKLAQKTKAEIIVPIYPLTPDHQYKEAFNDVLSLYQDMLKNTDADTITVMGDSAGGGFALAFSQLLLEKKLPQPGNIILLSPWLDITMKNPDIPALENVDPMLSAYGLSQIGLKWAGTTDPNYYMLSPINGEIKGLGRISLFAGTHEILLPDDRKFRDKAEAEGVTINYFEYHNMDHVFLLYPIPEADTAMNQIVQIMNGN